MVDLLINPFTSEAPSSACWRGFSFPRSDQPVGSAGKQEQTYYNGLCRESRTIPPFNAVLIDCILLSLCSAGHSYSLDSVSLSTAGFYSTLSWCSTSSRLALGMQHIRCWFIPQNRELEQEMKAMASLNQVTILGRVSRDIELKHLPSGSAVCEIGLAVNDKYKAKDGQWVEKTVWVDVSCFGRTAELASEYLRKGSETLVSGKLALDEWVDKSSGQKRTKLKVVAESVQFLGSREPSGERSTAQRRPTADDFGGKPQMPASEFPENDEVPF